MLPQETDCHFLLRVLLLPPRNSFEVVG